MAMSAGFPEECSGAAVRVAEDVVRFCSRHILGWRRRGFLGGELHGACAVAAFEKGRAGGVEADGGFIFVDEEVELNGGVAEFNGGRLPVFSRKESQMASLMTRPAKWLFLNPWFW